jgi:antitoxin component YwqK of YwqJK toxin-antitoxin module
LEDVIVAIHTNDIDAAKAGLERIMKKIKNRIRLVKFEPEDYKNFTIYYLEMPGFFRLFLGKMFKDIEKPFFTYVEDFVVFSNSSQTLKLFIDDYISGNTLDKNIDFVNFKDEFDVKSNITFFIRTPQMYENLYYYSTPEDRKAVKENKEFILSFEKIGFQLVSEGDMFKTTLLAMHNPNAVNADMLEVIEQEVTEGMFRDEPESKLFKIELSQSSLENDKFYKEYFENSENVKIEGHIQNHKPNGIWKSYYESGRIKNSVNYKDGIIEGEAWFYYDDENKTIKANAVFESDMLEGIYTEYFENGTQKAKMLYKAGLADGDAEFYYPNGKLKITAEYKDGLKNGKWFYFDEKGKEIGREKYKRGERVK